MAQSMQNAQILNANSRLALDVSDDGTTATQRNPDPKKESQRWNITLVSENRYLIENVQRNAVLAPDGDWDVVFQPKGGARQEWRLTFLGGDVYHIENPYSSGVRRLEIFKESTSEGATVSQFAPHDGLNQRWEVTAATSTLSPGLPKWIEAGGRGWAWGYGAYGQLGNGQTGDQTRPAQVGLPAQVTAKAVAVAAGHRHSLAVLEDGSVWAWGYHANGRLGNGQIRDDQLTPMQVSFPPSVVAKAVAAGDAHSLAAMDDGSVWAWGYYANGVLGIDQIRDDQWTPRQVRFSGGVGAKAVAVAAGKAHSLAAMDDGHVWAWGYYANGRLGIGQIRDDQPTPRQVRFSGGVGAKAVAAGDLHSLAAMDDGSVWAWGHYANGRLGNGQIGDDQWTPVKVRFSGGVGAKALAVAAGEAHSLAAMDDGSVWAWGNYANGRLGIGQIGDDQWTPVEVRFSGGVGAKALAVAAGRAYSLALLDDGSVWAWGENNRGQLGVGHTVDQSSPVRVGSFGAGGAEGIAVAAGEHHSLACDGVLRRR